MLVWKKVRERENPKGRRNNNRCSNRMKTIKITDASNNLYNLIDEASESHEPILITGKRNNAVLLSEGDWSSIQEMLYLLSIPNMRESIREGINSPVEECSEEPGW